MHLENGKFLMAPERYDKLLEVGLVFVVTKYLVLI